LSGNTLRIKFPPKTAPAEAAPWKIVLAITLIGVISRWMLQGRLLYDQEAAGLVFAAFHGGPSSSAVAPSGPLYFTITHALLPLFGSPEAVFVAISVLASGLAFAAIYMLGTALMGELAGLLSVALLISSPLFWFFGTVGLPYACDTLIAIISAQFSWQVASGRRALAPLALWLALAGSLRPWATLLMLPLALVAVLRVPRPASPRPARLAAPLLASSVLGLACVLPIGHLVGGLWIVPTSPNVQIDQLALLPHLARLIGAVGWGWGLGALPVLGALLLRALGIPGFSSRQLRLGEERAWFYAAWAIPWLLFALLARRGAPGQLAVGLPLLLLWSAGALVRLISVGSRRLATIAAALIIFGNAALFLLLPERPLFGYYLPSAAHVAYHDRRLAAAIVAIRGFSPDETLILADQWLPIQYYLPRYPLIPYRPDNSAPHTALAIASVPRVDARDASALVWFEPTLDAYNASPAETELHTMAVGALRILRPLPTEELIVDGQKFGLQRKALRK
jgi:hypothetical protein